MNQNISRSLKTKKTVKVDRPWEDYQSVWCTDTKRTIMLQSRVEEIWETGQIRTLGIRCKTPCSRNCRYRIGEYGKT